MRTDATPTGRAVLGAAAGRAEGPGREKRHASGSYSAVGPKHDHGAIDPRQAVLSALSEREFQALVVDGLKQRGFIVWTVPDMRMTTAGLPDIIAVHPKRAPLLMWELKTQRGRVRPEQAAALAHLDKIPGIDARIVRPADWDRLREDV